MDLRIAHALGDIERDFARRITVSDVAARAGLSRSRFEHLLKVETGECFKCWLRLFRLQRAQRLLSDFRLRIKEVAAHCGYPDAASFSHDFSRFLYKSPTAYRRSTFRQEIAQFDKGFRLTASRVGGVGLLLARKSTHSTTGREGPRSGGKPDGHTQGNKQT